jgi:hypothetical protein
MKSHPLWNALLAAVSLVLIGAGTAAADSPASGEKGAPPSAEAPGDCVSCHKKSSPALVMEWERSLHAKAGVGCDACHGAAKGEPDAWRHHGAWVSMLVTPKDCAQCHESEAQEFSRSHHARAGEILASLDNVLAEKIEGTPANKAAAANGCWQCHGGIVKFRRGAKGEILRDSKEGKPLLDPLTWPNSGMGRLNPDGSRGSCHACHARHSFEAKMSRLPDNCGKCHMGPDHPQIEIYKESKHGIAFDANRDRMALDQGSWVLGRDYSAAPTCATCHVSGYMTPSGVAAGNSHDVGERISWTLRPIVSTKLNRVIFEDGTKEDYPDTRPLPKIGDTLDTVDKVVENEKLVSRGVPRKVAKILTWQERRAAMKAVCANCHEGSYVDNFYEQYDALVVLYNEKFAKPAKALMDGLTSDGVLDARAPFAQPVEWVFYELWHHEGRRARHGASMMGPDYTHWHGTYEVGKNFYEKFLPAVMEAAAAKSPELGAKYRRKVDALLEQDEHLWRKGLSAEEAEALRKSYKARYNQ